MNVVNLSPGASKVGVGNILYVTMTSPDGKLESVPFIAVNAFDYNEVMEEIQKEGIIKSEDVSKRFCEIVVARDYCWKADTCLLDLGQRGRACTALQETVRYQHNTNHEMLRALSGELRSLYLLIECGSGDLHLLKVDKGDTLAQVRIFLDDGDLNEQVNLDLVGPLDYPWPDDMDEILTQAITKYLKNEYPKLEVGITVRAKKSDLVLAKEAIHAPLRRKPVERYRRDPKH